MLRNCVEISLKPITAQPTINQDFRIKNFNNQLNIKPEILRGNTAKPFSFSLKSTYLYRVLDEEYVILLPEPTYLYLMRSFCGIESFLAILATNSYNLNLLI